jgi:hypothetical protein
MSPQADFIVSNGTGAAVRSDLNVQFAAIVSNNSGATEPATMYAYQWWADTTTGLLKLRNSANSAWITMRQLDGEFSTVPVENGSAAAPSIYFKDSGTDSGFFSPGTDAVAISTAGTNRLHITSGGLVGIATSSPGSLLELSSAATSAAGGVTVTNTNTAGYSSVQLKNTGASGRTYTLSLGGNTSAFPGSVYLYDDTAGATRFLIDSSGRLGIGSTTVSRELILYKASAPAFHIQNSTSGTGEFDGFAFSSSGADATIWNYENGYLRFGTNDTERCRLDSSGRLLVGTSSHFGDGLLQIAGDAGASTGIPKITLRRNVALNTLGDASGAGQIEFTYIDGGVGARIAGQCEASAATNDYPTRLVFSVTADGEASPTQRLRITNGGDVFIHSGSNFGDTGVSISPGGSGYYSKTAGTGATSRLRFANANGQVGEISTSGSTTTYATSSDYRLKENVTLLTGATDRLKQIPVHRFNFIADPDTTVDGFIAHEAQAVVPECVTGEKDAVDDDGKPVHQGIDQSKLVPLLTAALQEAIGEIESLKARLTAAGI